MLANEAFTFVDVTTIYATADMFTYIGLIYTLHCCEPLRGPVQVPLLDTSVKVSVSGTHEG